MKISELQKILRVVKKNGGDIEIMISIENHFTNMRVPIQSVTLDYTSGTPQAAITYKHGGENET